MQSTVELRRGLAAGAIGMILFAGVTAANAAGVIGGGRFGPSCGVVPQEVIQRVNAIRASGARCGGRVMGPATPLNWDSSLYSAAERHSLDMAKRNYFEHTSPEGGDVSQRVSATRYNWRSVGENLAGGDRSVADALQSWLRSAHHCENLMDPKFRDVAVACEMQPGTTYGTYWTMVLGRR